MSNPIVIVGSLLKASIAFTAILLLLGAPAHAQSSDDDLFVEIPFTSRLKVDDTLYTGELQVKAAIIDEARRTLWSNDGSSTDGAQPTGAFSVDVTRGAFIFSLGQTGTDPLPSAVFAGSGRRFALIWIDAGRGFERFDPLPMGTAPRAANAYRLGGYSADEFYRVGQSIPIDNGSIIEPITSGNLAAFSNGTNNFTIGDGNDTDNKMLLVNRNGGADPALRFNTTTNTWQFSNDGTSFADVGTSTASEFNGPGSLTGAVDLSTTEVAGVLPVEKGGTAGTTSVQAQINLGVRVGVDVQAFTLNNFAATTDPGATNDSSQGYSVGSRWLNTSSNEEFICVVSSAAAAVWRSTTNTDASSIEDGSIATVDLADGAVTSAKILDGSIGAIDIAPNTISAANLAPNSVTGSELSPSGVAPGTYTVATVTVDDDGRITAASNGAPSAASVSSVGDSSSGATFGDGALNGTMLIYEGTSTDAFETRLQFAGDPTQDYTLTIPNVTGMLITSGDTGSVTTPMIANSAIDSAQIADNAVTGAKIAVDAVGASEIAADSIGPSELAPTAVAAGSYTLANITVDADGRIISASSNTVTGDISAVGDVTTGPAFVDGALAGTELVYEGTTIDAFENRLAFAGDPAADTIVTVPNITGTLVTTGDSATVTGTMVAGDTLTAGNLAADSVGNSEIATDAVGAAEILADAVGSAEIAADAVGSSEIAVDAVGASELAATAVAAGSYTLANITVDADGRITSASSNTETGDISAVGDVTTGPAFVDGVVAGSELIYEGTTIDAFEN
ncbi:MAG: hypothetical protein IT290_05935, partial [Deltaproteobacteria bacterium]|nr:hypothetical protein [Deltaproteobacteria bacterium]